jgi:hypothetical protein
MEVYSVGGPLWLYILLIVIEWAMLISMTALWLTSMQRAMEACHPISRKGHATGLVWLTFIPLFGIVWQYICITRTADTLANEYRRRNWSKEEDQPGMESGMVTAIVVSLFFIITLFFGRYLHSAVTFAIVTGICFGMYRHRERINAYRERIDKEPDAATAFGQIPIPHAFIAPQPVQNNPFVVPQPVMNPVAQPNPFLNTPNPFVQPNQQQQPNPFQNTPNPFVQAPVPPGYAPFPAHFNQQKPVEPNPWLYHTPSQQNPNPVPPVNKPEEKTEGPENPVNDNDDRRWMPKDPPPNQ